MQHTLLYFIQGVRVGDVVVEFGSVNISNFKSLQDIGSLVQHSQEVSVNYLHVHIANHSCKISGLHGVLTSFIVLVYVSLRLW